MNQPLRFVVFVLDEQRYALALAVVERVVRAAQVTPLPKAPDTVLGVINVQGEIIPVISLRKRNRLPERDLELTDLLVIARTARRKVALVVDEVGGVIACAPHEVLPAEQLMPGIEYVSGVLKREAGIVLIQDLDATLSLSDEKSLESALQPEDAP